MSEVSVFSTLKVSKYVTLRKIYKRDFELISISVKFTQNLAYIQLHWNV